MNGTAAFMPHDLLWGLSPRALPADAPAWALDVVGRGHPVVVRRERLAPGLIAVGVRGPAREQRYATHMAADHVQRQVTPEALIDVQSTGRQWPALQALREIRPLMNTLGLCWGVTGSAGFELASGIAALHQHSDLDLILRAPRRVERRWAAELIEALEGASCRIDVQLQVPAGAVALREWARGEAKVLLKTAQGAVLVSDPWQMQEACA